MFFLQILINSLVIGTQVLLLAAGLYLIYSVARMYHIALAGIMVSGAYSYYSLINILPALVALLFSVAFTIIMGILSYLLLASLIERKQGLLALLVSASLWFALKSLAAMIYGSGGKFLSEGVLSTFNLGGPAGINITQVGFYTLLFGSIIAISAYFILTFLPIGRTIRAIAQHSECASLVGIKENQVRMLIFAIAGGIAGLIGVFTAMNNSLTPSLGSDLIIMAFIAVLIGGVNFKGTILASFLLVLIPEFIISTNFGVSSLSSSWKMVIVFLLTLSLLILKPKGLFSISLRKS